MALKCTNQEGTVTGKHVYTGSFKEGMLQGQGSFEHGLTKQVFGPDFSNNYFLAEPPADPHKAKRRTQSPTTSPRSQTSKQQHNEQPPKILLDLFNLTSAGSKDEYLGLV